RALHDEDGAPFDARQLVEDRPHRREVGIPGVGRRRADAEEEEVALASGLRGVEREAQPLAVALEQLVQAGLVERRTACRQVADHDGVAERGEARPGHEAGVAGAEDPDSRHQAEIDTVSSLTWCMLRATA